MDQLWSIPLVLMSIIKECIAHAYLASLTSFNINVVLDLLPPHPVVDVLGLEDGIL